MIRRVGPIVGVASLRFRVPHKPMHTLTESPVSFVLPFLLGHLGIVHSLTR